MVSKDKQALSVLLIIAGLVTVIGLIFLLGGTDFSIIGTQGADVVYETNSEGVSIPVKVTYDVECSVVSDCVDYFISEGASSSDIPVDKISCDNGCVVDYR